MQDWEIVKNNIITTAKEFGYDTSKNIDAIAKAKTRFFGIDNWRNCPCVHDGTHACISDACKQRIESKGICHCNLIKKYEMEK